MLANNKNKSSSNTLMIKESPSISRNNNQNNTKNTSNNNVKFESPKLSSKNQQGFKENNSDNLWGSGKRSTWEEQQYWRWRDAEMKGTNTFIGEDSTDEKFHRRFSTPAKENFLDTKPNFTIEKPQNEIKTESPKINRSINEKESKSENSPSINRSINEKESKSQNSPSINRSFPVPPPLPLPREEKPEQKPIEKTEQKPEQKPIEKTEQKPEQKPEPKIGQLREEPKEQKIEQKPIEKTEPKPEFKIGAISRPINSSMLKNRAISKSRMIDDETSNKYSSPMSRSINEAPSDSIPTSSISSNSEDIKSYEKEVSQPIDDEFNREFMEIINSIPIPPIFSEFLIGNEAKQPKAKSSFSKSTNKNTSSSSFSTSEVSQPIRATDLVENVMECKEENSRSTPTIESNSQTEETSASNISNPDQRTLMEKVLESRNKSLSEDEAMPISNNDIDISNIKTGPASPSFFNQPEKPGFGERAVDFKLETEAIHSSFQLIAPTTYPDIPGMIETPRQFDHPDLATQDSSIEKGKAIHPDSPMMKNVITHPDESTSSSSSSLLSSHESKRSAPRRRERANSKPELIDVKNWETKPLSPETSRKSSNRNRKRSHRKRDRSHSPAPAPKSFGGRAAKKLGALTAIVAVKVEPLLERASSTIDPMRERFHEGKMDQRNKSFAKLSEKEREKEKEREREQEKENEHKD